MSFFKKISEGLQKTREALSGQISAVFRPGRDLDEADYEVLESALLRADAGPEATEQLLERVRTTLKDGTYEGTPADALREAVVALLDGAGAGRAATPPAAKPHVTLVVGVNGTGKTTTIAKLAHHYVRAGESVLLVACDTFRAAAADQLEVWAHRVGASIHRQQEGADPAAVAYDGVATAKARRVDRVLVDTAGRLHVKANLMAELEKVRRVIAKVIPEAPHETILVLDATMGQNGVMQARAFDRALGVSRLALTKLDGTAKGGVVLSITATMRLPLGWVGVGEGMDDLIPFDPAAYAQALAGDAPPPA